MIMLICRVLNFLQLCISVDIYWINLHVNSILIQNCTLENITHEIFGAAIMLPYFKKY